MTPSSHTLSDLFNGRLGPLKDEWARSMTIDQYRIHLELAQLPTYQLRTDVSFQVYVHESLRLARSHGEQAVHRLIEGIAQELPKEVLPDTHLWLSDHALLTHPEPPREVEVLYRPWAQRAREALGSSLVAPGIGPEAGGSFQEMTGGVLGQGDLTSTLERGLPLAPGLVLEGGALELQRGLGEDDWGALWEVQGVDGSRFFVKVLWLRRYLSISERRRFMEAYDSLARMRTPSRIVPRVLRVCDTGDFCYCVMSPWSCVSPWAPKEGAEDHAIPMAEDDLLGALIPLAQEVGSLHRQKIYHGGIAPVHVFRGDDGGWCLEGWASMSRPGTLERVGAGPWEDLRGLARVAIAALGGDLTECAPAQEGEILRTLPCSEGLKATLARACLSRVSIPYQDASALAIALAHGASGQALVTVVIGPGDAPSAELHGVAAALGGDAICGGWGPRGTRWEVVELGSEGARGSAAQGRPGASQPGGMGPVEQLLSSLRARLRTSGQAGVLLHFFQGHADRDGLVLGEGHAEAIESADVIVPGQIRLLDPVGSSPLVAQLRAKATHLPGIWIVLEPVGVGYVRGTWEGLEAGSQLLNLGDCPGFRGVGLRLERQVLRDASPCALGLEESAAAGPVTFGSPEHHHSLNLWVEADVPAGVFAYLLIYERGALSRCMELKRGGIRSEEEVTERQVLHLGEAPTWVQIVLVLALQPLGAITQTLHRLSRGLSPVDSSAWETLAHALHERYAVPHLGMVLSRTYDHRGGQRRVPALLSEAHDLLRAGEYRVAEGTLADLLGEGGDPTVLAYGHYLLGQALRRQGGRDPEAEAALRLALDLAHQGQLDGLGASCRRDLSRILVHRGHFDEALELLRDALTTHRALEDKAEEASDLSALCQVYLLTQQSESAWEVMERCLSCALESGHERLIAAAYHDRGRILLDAGRLEEARRQLLRALQHHCVAGDPLGECRVRSDLVGCFMELGEYVAAERHAAMGLTLARCLDTPRELFVSHVHRGNLALALNRTQEAWDHFRAARKHITPQDAHFRVELLLAMGRLCVRDARFGSPRIYLEEARGICHGLPKIYGIEVSLVEAKRRACRQEGGSDRRFHGLVRDLLAQDLMGEYPGPAVPPSGWPTQGVFLPPKMRPVFIWREVWDSWISELRRGLKHEGATLAVLDLQRQVDRFRWSETLRDSGLRAAPEGEGSRVARALQLRDPGEIVAGLREDHAYLVYHVLEDSIRAVAIARGQIRARTIPLSRSALLTLLGLSKARVGRAPTLSRETITRLSEDLLAPFLSDVTFIGARDPLVILPDGALWSLPFELLRVPDHSGQRLISRHPVYYRMDLAPSAPVDRGRAGSGEILALVNPCGDLPGAETEVERLERAWPGLGVRVKRGLEANASALLKHGADAEIIHLAVHGRVDRGGRAALQLAPCAPELLAEAGTLGGLEAMRAAAEGVVRSEWLSRLSLRKARVVFAAHCSPPVPMCRHGLQPFNEIAFALRLGGARSVLFSRYAVSDQEAAQVAVTFYDELVRRRSTMEAWWCAMGRIYAANGRPKSPGITYDENEEIPGWTGFSLLGEPD